MSPDNILHAPDGHRFLTSSMYLPHEECMRLVDELSIVSKTHAESRTLMVKGSNLYELLPVGEDGMVQLQPYFVIELVAQSMGAWVSYFDILHGKHKVDFGMLLGGRANKFYVDKIYQNTLIETRSNMLYMETRLASFEYEVFQRPINDEHLAAIYAMAQEFLGKKVKCSSQELKRLMAIKELSSSVETAKASALQSKSLDETYFSPTKMCDALALALQRVSLGIGEVKPYERIAKGRINIYQADENEVEEIFASSR